ncbi:hypothetical protein FDK21_19475 [Cohaesibacter sp. CAU 1516]|uniref:hypothetical protein n=1 Tax=Cohaesibacter sp. CAU 1516 TaxID=2576038 RepID=UPI0010FDC5C8|nr:hypothetical protein [Cohaesibacter sp. CAU 1516]TLP42590.1 hypothetical protein FDK21_19475 [Cohaesibacter sp. CAU 1516]
MLGSLETAKAYVEASNPETKKVNKQRDLIIRGSLGDAAYDPILSGKGKDRRQLGFKLQGPKLLFIKAISNHQTRQTCHDWKDRLKWGDVTLFPFPIEANRQRLDQEPQSVQLPPTRRQVIG